MTRARYTPATSVIDPTKPGGIDAMIAFHRATFGNAVMEDEGDEDDDEDDGEEGPKLNEHGYPDNTPVKEMDVAHQAG